MPGAPDRIDPNLARLYAIARSIRAPWQPEPALTVNQATLRVVKFEGHFADFHRHDVDECYVVLEGELLVELEGEPATRLVRGDAYVVRAGTVHRPFALPQATVLLIT
jgi:mannose-6-phosphate isomerase-like protein (cupin superfamily)